MVPRVLVVQEALDLEGVEQTVAPDGETALRLLDHDDFDAVLVDLGLPPLDGWMVLAALGSANRRPRLVATVADRADIPRARALGADLCVLAGTNLHARALGPAWQHAKTRHRPISSRRPTTSGVRA